MTEYKEPTPEMRAELRQHKLWLESEGKEGKQLNWSWSGRDLRFYDLSWKDLRLADLSGCDLRGIDFGYANLSGADLRRVNLRGADLSFADFTDVKMEGSIGLPYLINPKGE
jgi:uncharacterized protein YjbI with pentapeptide repeats